MKKGVVLLVVLVLFAVGCGVAGGEEEAGDTGEMVEAERVELEFFYPCDDVNWVTTIEELGEAFMNENQDIILHMRPSDKGIYTENLKIKAALGEFPDIMEVRDPLMFYEAGKLGILPDEIGALVENPFTAQGEVYAVPLYDTTYGIVYNQVLFKKYGLKLPQTYEEFLDICDKLKSQGVVPLAIGGSKEDHLNYWLQYFFQTEVLNNETDWIINKNRKEAAFQDENVIEMLVKYKELMTGPYILEDSISMNDNQLVTELVNGRVAMIFSGPWIFSQIIDAYPQATESDKTTLGEDIRQDEDPVRFRLGWFFMPDEQGRIVAVSERGASFAISSDCAQDEKKREAASRFFQYFYQSNNYRDILRSMYALPTTKEAVLYPAITVQQKLLVDYRYAEKSTSYLGNDKTPEGFRESLYKILNSVVTDMISVESAAEKLDERWEELLR